MIIWPGACMGRSKEHQKPRRLMQDTLWPLDTLLAVDVEESVHGRRCGDESQGGGKAVGHVLAARLRR